VSESNSRLVYSTNGGRLAAPQEVAGRQAGGHGQHSPAVPNDGVVRVMRTKQGRGGKTVTLVTACREAPPN
jgi:translation initiation factor 1 (eIF-1/SUI1)